VCLWESSYPYLLKQIPDPPAVLYYRGSLGLTSKDILVSIVGTRKISPQGEKRTRMWTSELAERGVVIVSGLALGTDTRAHHEALNLGAYTMQF
jgi:DNA processing protein